MPARSGVLLVSLLLALGGCGHRREPGLVVFAAASLAGPLDESVRQFVGCRVELHFAASRLLAAQVESGAPADVVLFAGPDPMDRLEQAGRLAAGSRRPLFGNHLVVATRQETAPSLDGTGALARLERLAVADPALAPAGQYAREALTSLGLWQSLESQGRLLLTGDVRMALGAVRSGSAPAAIVYATDLSAAPGCVAALDLDAWLAQPVRYVGAALPGPREEQARALLDHLASPEGLAPFLELGFVRLD